MYAQVFKRLIDILVSVTLLVLFSPIILLLTLVLYVVNQGEPFFVQPRPGKDAKIFNILKFRSMNNKRDAQGELLPDMERMTPIGQFIRKSSLDELPQLFNVFKGDMSLVGPRPLLVSYLPLYNAEQAKRHLVRPGITGWSQVNGRNAISWEQKFKYDLYYINHLSLFLDLKILWMTVLKVIKKDGISASENTTMPFFLGNKK